MHSCSGLLQSRLRLKTVPGCRSHLHRLEAVHKLSAPCRGRLQVSARASAKPSQKSNKAAESEEAHAIESIADARTSFTSLFGEQSAALDVLSKAEDAYDEGSLDDSYMDSLTAMANEIGDFASKSGTESTAKLEQAESQAQAANEKYLRLNADFDNFRKRSANERNQLGERTRGDVIKGLIPLVDSFEAAQTSITAETENEKKINGAYQGLYKQMVEVFKSLGVEAVPGVGQPFDPNVHEAIMRENNETLPDGTVLQEFRRGFRLGKTLLRPGMVKVSYSEAPVEQKSAGGNGTEGDAEAAIDVEVEEVEEAT